MKLYLIRHGYTVMNESGTFNGHMEDALTEAGKQQVELLGQKMQTIPLDMIWSSDMERTIQTAEAISKYQKISLPIQQDARLRERKMGKYEGTLSSDLKKIAADHDMNMHDYYNIDEEIEKDNSIIMRFKQWLEESIMPSGAQHVCAVSHGAFIRTIVSDILTLRGSLYFGSCSSLANASITILEYKPEKQKRILKTLNDYSHVAHTF